jgi:hypothetical protein
MRIDSALMIAGLFMTGPLPAHSQNPATLLASQPVRFESWRPEAMPGDAGSSPSAEPTAVPRPRGRSALIGGAIGTVAGLAFCTVVSNLVNDPGSGFSTCTLNGYLLTGGLGLAAGFVMGLIV